MIKFKGRTTLKEYMPQKPIKRGIKVWMRADTLSGYVSAFEVNMAKKVGSVEKGSGVNVVKTLTKDIQNTFDISALTTSSQVLISSLICTNSVCTVVEH